MKTTYYIVDVFTDKVFSGAQIAVFPEAEGLSAAQMQTLAREINLTETVFICAGKEENSYRVKIFSPSEERDFSGHATIAAGFILISESGLAYVEPHTTVSLEQNSGLLDVTISKREDGRFFVQFTRAVEAVTDRFVPSNNQLAAMLSLDVKEIGSPRYNTLLVSCDKPYLVVPLNSFDVVRRAVFNSKEWSTEVAPLAAADEILLFATKSDLPTSNFHGRLVGPSIGLAEDPPIASSMPTFAAYLAEHEHIKQGTYSFDIDRGAATTRKSVLTVELIAKEGRALQLRVGGPAVLVAKGEIIAP